MAEHKRSARQWLTTFTVAASLLISSSPLAFAGPGDTNSINDGQIIKGGNYYNTVGDKTTFQNSGGNGIYVPGGSTVIGKEVNGVGGLTGNGGNILINAPSQVVRLDGNMDVSAGKNGGFYVGNGGNVQINSAFLFQNGQITANGINGGNASFNVGAVTVGASGKINANGFVDQNGNGGAGGTVKINSPGTVDINRGAVIDVSGKTIGNYDTNLINIKGGLVNMDGVLNANGVGSAGGTVKIAAVGATPAIDYNALLKASDFISKTEREALNGKDSFFRHGTNNGSFSQDGNIVIGNYGKISANGASGVDQTRVDGSCCYTQPSKGYDGGNVFLEACKNIIQYGTITANGGNAGRFTVTDNGMPNPKPRDIFGENGLNGGNGGNVVFAYHGALITRAGSLTQVKGGDAANGQNATPMGGGFTATGGKGGDGGNGGNIIVKGPLLTMDNKSTFDLSGGKAGKEGNLGAACGSCTLPGLPGAPGNPGHIIKKTPTADCPYCAPGLPPGPPPVTPPTPPTTPPTTPPGNTIYPKENPQLGGTLPGNIGPLVNYNRSVYMARSPLPLEKRIAVAPPVTPKVVPAPKLRKPAPPQRKIPVRGYW
jgi:hypothetical protein